MIESAVPHDLEKYKSSRSRYIIWHDEHGIYLGRGKFSLKPVPSLTDLYEQITEGLPDSAPTFKTLHEAQQEERPGFPDKCRLIEIDPSGPNNRASKADCADRLLPIWSS